MMTRDELENNLLAGGSASTLAAGAGIIGGQRAKKANQEALMYAKQLQKNGMPAEDIERATGWHYGPDGEWKFRISDAKAQFRVPVIGEGGRYSSDYFKGRMGDVLSHPDLYANYPALESIPYSQDWLGENFGRASPGVGSIEVNSGLPADKIPGVATHELQHVIQALEGAGLGGDPATADHFFNGVASVRQSGAAASPDELYARLAGEVEANIAGSEMQQLLNGATSPDKLPLLTDAYSARFSPFDQLVLKTDPNPVSNLLRAKPSAEAPSSRLLMSVLKGLL